jgi:hypothetical protein
LWYPEQPGILRITLSRIALPGCTAAKSRSVTFLLHAGPMPENRLFPAAAVFKWNQTVSQAPKPHNLKLQSPSELKIQKKGHKRHFYLTGLIFAADAIRRIFCLVS